MYAITNADAAWAARANLDYAFNALAHGGTPSWDGVAADNADAIRTLMITQAHRVRDLLHDLAVLLEELEALEASAMGEVA